MGIQLKSGTIYGKVGSVIYRRWRGLNLIQGRPKHMKQSIATKAAAAEFGLASTTSANIRKSLSLFYKVPDKTMGTRLNKEVLRAIQACSTKERLDRDFHDADLSLLKGFEFNEHAPLSTVLPVSPQLVMDNQGLAKVSVPAFSPTAIRHAGESSKVWRYRLRIVALAYNFREEYADVLAVHDQVIPRRGITIDWELSQKPSPGSILLIGMALYAEQGHEDDRLLLNAENWSPACILGMSHIEEHTHTVTERERNREEHEELLSEEGEEELLCISNPKDRERFNLPHASGKGYCKKLVTAYKRFMQSNTPRPITPLPNEDIVVGRSCFR